jgi:DNA polymerase elongation subunit (family B)
VYAADHGAEVGFLQQSVTCPGFSILIPVNHDRLQLLLFNMSGPSSGFQGAEQARSDRSSSDSWTPGYHGKPYQWFVHETLSHETLLTNTAVAPNGMIYAKPHVRRGLLGRMLKELLDTRVMVKHAMKGVKTDKVSCCFSRLRYCAKRGQQALRRVLDARQLSLKFICNVTYGYTSATFSGRMPAVEIADSIVQSGRETLEKVSQGQSRTHTAK